MTTGNCYGLTYQQQPRKHLKRCFFGQLEKADEYLKQFSIKNDTNQYNSVFNACEIYRRKNLGQIPQNIFLKKDEEF